LDRLSRQIRAVPPAPGFDEVLVPGDLESRAREVRSRDGIPIPDVVWDSLTDVAQSLGIEAS
jgi:LDH2 family malate/lactate/ureidoglycolate dehydrogenase